jgi:hypothetical protein
MKDKLKNILDKALVCGGTFAILQELFSKQIGPVLLFTLVMFIGLFLITLLHINK